MLCYDELHNDFEKSLMKLSNANTVYQQEKKGSSKKLPLIKDLKITVAVSLVEMNFLTFRLALTTAEHIFQSFNIELICVSLSFTFQQYLFVVIISKEKEVN